MNVTLSIGGHEKVEDGLCLLEACALFAGEEHSDRPACVCPVLSAFLRKVNNLSFHDDETRTRVLVPLIEVLVGTQADEQVQVKRAYLLTESTVRELLPIGLNAFGLHEAAQALTALPALDPSNPREALRDYDKALSQVEDAVSASGNEDLDVLFTILFRSANTALYGLSKVEKEKWWLEDVALSTAHAYGWVFSDEDGPSGADGFSEAVYEALVSLVHRAAATR